MGVSVRKETADLPRLSPQCLLYFLLARSPPRPLNPPPRVILSQHSRIQPPGGGGGVRGSCSAGASRLLPGTPSAGVLTHTQRRELGNSAGWGSFLPPRVSPALGSFHWSALRDSKMKMVFPP